MSLKEFFDAFYAERYRHANRCRNYIPASAGGCLNGDLSYCHACVNFREEEC